MKTHFRSKNHSVSWITKRPLAVLLPASGKTRHSKTAPPDSHRAYKMHHSHSVSLCFLPSFVSPQQPPVRFLLETRYRKFLTIFETKQLALVSEILPVSAPRKGQACFLGSAVRVETLVDNEDSSSSQNYLQVAHSKCLECAT